MLVQARDFRDESEALYALLGALDDSGFEEQTQFKNWTINNVLGHLHFWNWAADLTLKDRAAFEELLQQVTSYRANHDVHGFERKWLKGLKDSALLNEWHTFYLALAERYAAADPKKCA